MNVHGQSGYIHGYRRPWWTCFNLKCFNNSYLADNEMLHTLHRHIHISVNKDKNNVLVVESLTTVFQLDG